jgi:hypothetical protein
MPAYLDPRTLNVGDTLVIRDCEDESRIVIEKVEFLAKSEPGYGRNSRRYVECTISGGRMLHRVTGSGSSAKDFRPDGTCSIYQTGRGLSLEVIRAAK